MFDFPPLIRLFSGLLFVLGLYLAGENLLITADQIQANTGASTISSAAIALVAQGIQMVFVGWLLHEGSMRGLLEAWRKNPVKVAVRCAVLGIGIAWLQHFDLITTASHPAFSNATPYFFWVVVLFFVLGPEVAIAISVFLWEHANDQETRKLANTNHKAAENSYRKAERQQLTALAEEAGKAAATESARKRWGPST